MKVGHEFYVIMVKRKDGEVYANLSKTTQHIYLLKEDAEKDIQEFPHHHIVKMIAYLDWKEKAFDKEDFDYQTYIEDYK